MLQNVACLIRISISDELWNFHATIIVILEFIFPFIVCKILVSDDARETGDGERFGEGQQQQLSVIPSRSQTTRASVARSRTRCRSS